MIKLWTVGPFDSNLIQMDDYPADSCAISPLAFLLVSVYRCFNFAETSRCDHHLQLVQDFCHRISEKRGTIVSSGKSQLFK